MDVNAFSPEITRAINQQAEQLVALSRSRMFPTTFRKHLQALAQNSLGQQVVYLHIIWKACSSEVLTGASRAWTSINIIAPTIEVLSHEALARAPMPAETFLKICPAQPDILFVLSKILTDKDREVVFEKLAYSFNKEHRSYALRFLQAAIEQYPLPTEAQKLPLSNEFFTSLFTQQSKFSLEASLVLASLLHKTLDAVSPYNSLRLIVLPALRAAPLTPLTVLQRALLTDPHLAHDINGADDTILHQNNARYLHAAFNEALSLPQFESLRIRCGTIAYLPGRAFTLSDFTLNMVPIVRNQSPQRITSRLYVVRWCSLKAPPSRETLDLLFMKVPTPIIYQGLVMAVGDFRRWNSEHREVYAQRIEMLLRHLQATPSYGYFVPDNLINATCKITLWLKGDRKLAIIDVINWQAWENVHLDLIRIHERFTSQNPLCQKLLTQSVEQFFNVMLKIIRDSHAQPNNIIQSVLNQLFVTMVTVGTFHTNDRRIPFLKHRIRLNAAAFIHSHIELLTNVSPSTRPDIELRQQVSRIFLLSRFASTAQANSPIFIKDVLSVLHNLSDHENDHVSRREIILATANALIADETIEKMVAHVFCTSSFREKAAAAHYLTKIRSPHAPITAEIVSLISSVDTSELVQDRELLSSWVALVGTSCMHPLSEQQLAYIKIRWETLNTKVDDITRETPSDDLYSSIYNEREALSIIMPTLYPEKLTIVEKARDSAVGSNQERVIVAQLQAHFASEYRDNVRCERGPDLDGLIVLSDTSLPRIAVFVDGKDYHTINRSPEFRGFDQRTLIISNIYAKVGFGVLRIPASFADIGSSDFATILSAISHYLRYGGPCPEQCIIAPEGPFGPKQISYFPPVKRG